MTDNEKESAAAPNRKRRLSKKERKALKKKQKQSHKAVSATESTHEAQNKNQHNTEVPEESFVASYTPVPIPEEIKDGNYDDDGGETQSEKGGAKKLGKWFPEAVVIKTTTVHNSVTQHKKKKKNEDDETRTSSLVLFYQYAIPPFRQSQVRQLMAYLTSVAKVRNLGGRIRVSNEGVNCTLSSLATDRSASVPSAAANLRHFASDLRNFSPVFNETDFKYIDNLPPDRHFKDLKILPVKELVFYGISEKDAPLSEGGVHLDAKDYHKMLARDDAVVIDVRNHYEALIGRFDGQNQFASDDGDEDDKNEKKNGEELESSTNEGEKGRPTSRGGGATYIDPMMRKSTDFPDWLAKPETKEKLANKKVRTHW